MTVYTATEFDIRNEDAGNPMELKFRKLDQNLLATAEISFGDDSSTYLSFRSAAGASMIEHMLIDSNGNVGIGMASTGEKLEVNGTVKATAFSGNLNGSQIATGTIDDARLPLSISRTADVDARFDPSTGHDHDGVDSKKIPALSIAYFDSLDGASLTNLNGSQITTGTVAAARIDTAIVRTSNLAVPNGIATLDANTLVVQNPSNATATPAAGKIPIADASGKLAAGWGGNANTVATLDANTRVVQPANTVWDGTAARSASPTPAANAIPVLNASAKFAGSITGDADTVDTFHASSTPAPNTIAVGNASGKLASGWGGSASTVATLDASSLVVQNPANATATPTASKIPIADVSGKLVAGWGGNASTVATLDANTRVVQAANTL